MSERELPDSYWRACLKAAYDAFSLGVYCQGWYDENKVFHKRTEWQDGHNAANDKVRERWFCYLAKCLDPTPAFAMQIELVASGLCFWGGENDDQLEFLCSDMFAWGCADAERITDEDLSSVYELWKTDPEWGLDKWVLRKRNEQPQAPVKRLMIDAGVWDQSLEALPENLYDKACLTTHPDCSIHQAAATERGTGG